MRHFSTRVVALPLTLLTLLALSGCSSVDILGGRVLEGEGAKVIETEEVTEEVTESNLGTAIIPNILQERINVPLAVVNVQLDDAFEQLFFGDPDSEAVYREQEDGSAYIEDIYHNDVRTDSMGYGMLVAVQLDRREVFDKLWTWTTRNMQNQDGPSRDLLRWNCDVRGEECEDSASTDAMSIIATALYLADSRWGAGETHDYALEANSLIDAMVKTEFRNGGIIEGVVNCFDVIAALPRLNSVTPSTMVPVDYLMPAFYEYWASKREDDAELWQRIAHNSRSLLALISNAPTGLYPESVYYTGAPVPGELDYRGNSSRALLNLALDHLRFGPYPWVSTQNELLLDFFLTQGVDSYAAEYSISGEALVSFNTPAHRSMVALAAGTTLKDRHDPFLQNLLDEKTPTGTFRYYDGMLYLMSLVVLSGQFSLD